MTELERIVELQKECTRIKGMIFMYIARPIFERFGMEGEKAIRSGLRAYGKYRGKLMRKWHKSLGLPINMESLLRYWDHASTRLSGIYSSEAIFTPYYVEHPATPCSIHEFWKEENWEHYGYIFCDEEHQEVCMAYHPKAIVEIHENLNKGDPRCYFKWMMIPEIPEEKIDKSVYEIIDKWARENPLEDAIEALKRTNRSSGLLYYFLADSIIAQFAEEGRDMVKASLKVIGTRLGRELKEKLGKTGEDVTIINAFDHSFFGLPYKYHWKMKVESSDDHFIAQVEYCPFAEYWISLGKKDVGEIFCQEIYSSIFKELSTVAEIKIPECKMKGGSKCRFDFKI
jgi:hypothetical protein